MEQEDISFVELSRNDLLTMTSKELEAQIKQLTAVRNLTTAEQREIKRQRRLIKNREYAQTSRVKKKQFVEELRQENKILKDRIKSLEEENHFLRFGGSAPHLGPANTRNQATVAQSEGLLQHQPLPESGSIPHNFFFSFSQADSESPSPSTEPSSSSDDVFYESEDVEQLFFPSTMEQQYQHPSPMEHYHHVPASNGFAPSFVGSLCLMVVLFSFAIFIPNLLTGGFSSSAVPSALLGPQLDFRTSRSLMFASQPQTSQTSEAPPPNALNHSIRHNATSSRLTFEQVLADETSHCLPSPLRSLTELTQPTHMICSH